MNRGAQLGSVEAVHDLRLHLKRLCHEFEHVLAVADADALRARAAIDRAVADAKRAVRHCDFEVARAREALAVCRLRRPEPGGRPVDCADETMALERARQQLREAEVRLADLASANNQLDDAFAVYSQRAFALRAFLACEMARGDDYLAGKLAALESYLAVPAPPVFPVPTGGSDAGPRSLRQPTAGSPTGEDTSAGLTADSVAADYRRLRGRTPSPEIRRMVNPPGPKLDPIYGHAVARLDADHIVPVKEIISMPGFAALPDDRKVAILNLSKNFLGVSREVNASRGERRWAEYEGHPLLGPVPPQVRDTMIVRETQAREDIRRAIDEASRS